MTPSQSQFDLQAFCSAIEHADADAQQQFYADTAEVRLQSLESPHHLVQVLVGHSQIHDWITAKHADPDTTFTVVYHWIEADQVMITEECHHPDGTRELSASTAHIANGHITQQSLVLVETSRPGGDDKEGT